jgi:hypothetical protein
MHFYYLTQFLKPIAIMLQLVRPAWPRGRPLGDDWLTRMYEAAGALIGLPRELRHNMAVGYKRNWIELG